MRTFIAIELPVTLQQPVHQAQAQLQEALRDRTLGEPIAWTPVVKIHLTLRFLGDTSHRQQATITSQLTALTRSQAPFALTLGGFGGFPHLREPNVVWLDVQGALAPLQQLQARVEQVAQAAGFAPETRAFTPH